MIVYLSLRVIAVTSALYANSAIEMNRSVNPG